MLSKILQFFWYLWHCWERRNIIIGKAMTNNMCETWSSIYMRIGIILMPIRIWIWIWVGINMKIWIRIGIGIKRMSIHSTLCIYNLPVSSERSPESMSSNRLLVAINLPRYHFWAEVSESYVESKRNHAVRLAQNCVRSNLKVVCNEKGGVL